jgi:hypothetical protein
VCSSDLIIEKNNFGDIMRRLARLEQRVKIGEEIENHENSNEAKIPTDEVEQKTPQNVAI